MPKQNEKQQSVRDKQTHLTRKITFRLSESEYAQIADDLSVCGLNISSLVRKHLLDTRVDPAPTSPYYPEQRLDGLLKHVHNETRGAYSSPTAQVLKDLSAYARVLTDSRP